MNVDHLTIQHALSKALEDALWQHGMECVSNDPTITEVVIIDNTERIQELELALEALDRLI